MQREGLPIKRSFSQTPLHAPAKLPRRSDVAGLPRPFSVARNSVASTSGSQQATSSTAPLDSRQNPARSKRWKKSRLPPIPLRKTLEATYDGPLHDGQYIEEQFNTPTQNIKALHKESPKVPLNNFCMLTLGGLPSYHSQQGSVIHKGTLLNVWRTTIHIELTPPIVAIGDHAEKKRSAHLAALSAVYQLNARGLLEDPEKSRPPKVDGTTTKQLSDGSIINYDKARNFMDYYCRTFNFAKPDIDLVLKGPRWEATLSVDDRKIGMSEATSKKGAQIACYLDVVQYIEGCDPELWKKYLEAAKTGADLGMAPRVSFQISPLLDESLADLCSDIRRTDLYQNRPWRTHTDDIRVAPLDPLPRLPRYYHAPGALVAQSNRLKARRQRYLQDPAMERFRQSRASLPIYERSRDLLTQIAANDVTILMATTGSGKTTQLPQIILDDFIDRGEGAKCHILCTQPRRLAAISVADRVSKERGEPLGQSVGYQVRFEANLPEPHGSITFCTIGIFLKRLQSALAPGHGAMSLDEITHVLVDEVHERDVDTDLLLVVLKQIMQMKKAQKKPFKIVLMSATIDPTLFRKYFADEAGTLAPVLDIPGRLHPVEKHFMDDFMADVLRKCPQVRNERDVPQYICQELGPSQASRLLGKSVEANKSAEEIDCPPALVAATVAKVFEQPGDGHALVFLPGWEEITAVQKALFDLSRQYNLGFEDSSRFSIHLLHSSVPLSEQQAIFEPPSPGVRRVILSTNIAETSVTIPDVVYVIDTAKIKEQRYDPDRHMSSLVSAWVGSSNLNQRAGRAGRHRPGDYFGLLSKLHANSLHVHQTVEMKRADLTNVVMHVKALNFPGMTTEEVLGAVIEPPDPTRVAAAMKDLKMVGALDEEKRLTPLGRVLLQLPVDVQMGRLVLYGSFFRCLDDALLLAAILTNRDPFMSPMHLREESAARKNSWSPDGLRSDPLATLAAFYAWDEMDSRGDYSRANWFCSDNFLSKPTLLLIRKIKAQLLQAIYRTGIIDISAGEQSDDLRNMTQSSGLVVPPALNANKGCLPLLAALISVACQPKFAMRTGEKTYRTMTDKVAFIHPSSVNHRKWEALQNGEGGGVVSKQLYAFAEKRRNDTVGSPSTYLITTTRLDPLTYVVFGAHKVEGVPRGLECDNWLPIVGNLDTLDDLQRLKMYMDACMARVFQGIVAGMGRQQQELRQVARQDGAESESGDELDENGDRTPLTRQEIQDLNLMTRGIVRLLTRYNEERNSNRSAYTSATASANTSRAATPINSPFSQYSRLPSNLLTNSLRTYYAKGQGSGQSK